MLKKIKEINKKLNAHSELFMLMCFYFLSIVLNWFAFSLIEKLNLFPQNILNLAIGVLIFLIVFLFSLNMLTKTILWINLRPKLTEKDRKKINREIDKLSEKEKKLKKLKEKTKIFLEIREKLEILKESEIRFKTWVEFSIFSSTIMATSYTPFFWIIKHVFKSLKFQIKNLFDRNKKKVFFAWRKSIGEKDKKEYYTIVYFPDNIKTY